MPSPDTNESQDRLTRGIAIELRHFVGGAGRLRALPFTAYVGVPGVERSVLHHDTTDTTDDPTLLADLVERAVDGVSEAAFVGGWACAWVTRPDGLEPDTRDLAWLIAARTGFARHGLDLPAFFIVGRYGWHEVLSGRARRWYRVRRRPRR